MQLAVPTVNSALFSHNARAKTLAAEISDLGCNFRPLYDDACDVGIALSNPRTGNVTRWAVSEEVRDAERELIAWYLVPTPESLRKNAELAGYVMTLYND